MKYSIIVPVFNRPDEVQELLESLTQQTLQDFEVIIVEDGSQKPCREVCESYASRLDLHYYDKENSGPGQSRNYGAERACGDWFIVLDSDVVLPQNYLAAADAALYDTEGLQSPSCDAWGGPDAAHPDFTPIQKAISYAMTSFFTTGGIRGGKGAKLDKFYPRSYNMGVRNTVWRELGGFSKMRFGEDIDFSYRIVESGHPTRLLTDAWVWHKRRTDLRKFFRQVFNSGIARINLTKRHPGTLKAVHLLPMVFTLGVILLTALSAAGLLTAAFASGPCARNSLILSLTALAPIVLYALIIFTDSALKNHSLHVGLLSIPAAFTQLMGYGLGFIQAWWRRCVRGKDEFSAFDKTFYK